MSVELEKIVVPLLRFSENPCRDNWLAGRPAQHSQSR